jgi:hypothetical protein
MDNQHPLSPIFAELLALHSTVSKETEGGFLSGKEAGDFIIISLENEIEEIKHKLKVCDLDIGI